MGPVDWYRHKFNFVPFVVASIFLPLVLLQEANGSCFCLMLIRYISFKCQSDPCFKFDQPSCSLLTCQSVDFDVWTRACPLNGPNKQPKVHRTFATWLSL